MIDLGVYIAEKRTRPDHTEAGVEDMLSFNVACNPYIAEMRTSPYHTEAGAMDILSFKVACNKPGNTAMAISGSRGLWG